MLIKEYRIPLPLTVEEYRIAQLYMIQKKSRDESKGVGSGIEILVNEPYEDGPGGMGQYTHKIYHVGSHLPGWLKGLLPKSALVVEEEAWNAYPYTKTKYKCPFVEKFSVEIETKYFNDGGHQDNVFQMSGSELRTRIVDEIDIVREQLTGAEYKKEEDPRFYISHKSGRGPLEDNWIDEYWKCCNGQTTPLPNGMAIMCAYKLCKVEFRYWGMQSKLEKFIHDTGLRKTMLRAHKQAWAWQDEWHGLSIADIRRLERETQEELAMKMCVMSDDEGENDKENQNIPNNNNIPKTVISENSILCDTASVPTSLSIRTNCELTVPDNVSSETVDPNYMWRRASRTSFQTALHSPGGMGSQSSFDIQVANWRMESIMRDSDSSSDEEFYDCQEELSDDAKESLTKWSSIDLPVEEDYESAENDSIFSSIFIQKVNSERSKIQQQSSVGTISSNDATPPLGSPQVVHQTVPTVNTPHCSTTILMLVLHGGCVLDSVNDYVSKKSDITTFKGSFESVVRQHYPTLVGHVTIRLVPCPSIFAEALAVLSSLSPYSFDSSHSPTTLDSGHQVTNSVPLGALPLFAVSAPDYQEQVSRLIMSTNQVYHEFLKSNDGNGFNGQVVLVGDSVGSILGYDALCRQGHYNNRMGSDSSIAEASPTPGDESVGKNSPQISVSNGGNSNSFQYQRSHSHSGEQLHPNSNTESGSGGFHRLLSAPLPRRRSSSSSDQGHTHNHHVVKLDFEISDFFMFGSPVGHIMAFRKMYSDYKNNPPAKPACSQLYNLFHLSDPCTARIEPLISARFSSLPPITVSRYQKYPLGDGQPNHLLEYIQSNAMLFSDSATGMISERRLSEISIQSTMSGIAESVSLSTVTNLIQKWWGTKRLDHALYCPEGLSSFPLNALPHLFHASYWESTDVLAFILRQIAPKTNDIQLIPGIGTREAVSFIPSQPREKWLRKRTSVKLKNVSPNHRANDIIVGEGEPQLLQARFMYGPLDMVALTGEKVDIHVMKETPAGEWIQLSTEITDKSGRLSYTIPPEKSLGFGLYPIRMIIRGDHTSVDFFLAVIPPNSEAVVFSIDGSFTASMSVTGRDPKVRAGAVDVVRHWQELGYLILYITGRPDIQKYRVMAWLAHHNFPHGLVSFADGLSTDPLGHKADYLRNVKKLTKLKVHAGYGSSKDIQMYASLGLKPDQIFIVGKTSKKQQSQAQVLNDGYAAHLSQLTKSPLSRQTQGNARMLLPRSCFNLPGQNTAVGSTRGRRTACRTSSFPLTCGNTESSNMAITSGLGKIQAMSPRPPISKV
ncbi:Protein retinal degeneration B [Nymphon striatum]|nr:Protein retinal degeneration B [Nymphon striatum]